MPRPAPTHGDRLARLAKRGTLLRLRDLQREGIPRVVVARMVERGQLERVARGLYAMPGRPGATEHQSAVEVAKRVPKAVLCLLSALRFHGLTTQAPFEIWIALPRGTWTPRLEYPRLRVMRFSGPALTQGIEERLIEGVLVRVFNVPKTVADCFKYRNKIGLDVALEALREAWRAKRVKPDELTRYARLCRVENVMRPYLEALTA